MSAAPKRVVILGGGITGLSTAYHLQEQIRDERLTATVSLLESDQRLGGKILTEVRDGFIIEGGPDSFISQKPWAMELCHKLGLSAHLERTNTHQTQTYVFNNGSIIPLPNGLMLLAPTRLMPFLKTPLFSWPGKLRMGLDLLLPSKKADEDESLAGFVRRRLGQEAVDRLAGPMMAGIYAGDPERMSLKATFPQFAEMERNHRSLTLGMLARRRETMESGPRSAGPPPTMFMTLRGGLIELVDTLTRRLDRVELVTGRKAVGLRREGGRSRLTLSDGMMIEADAVVFTTPAYVTAELIEPLDPSIAQELRGIPYVSTATVSLAYRKEGFGHPLNGFGFVVSDGQNRKIMACTWTSTKFPHRAPADHLLLRCFVGGARQERLAQLPEEELVRMVREELRDILGIAAQPVLARVFRWDRANPQYEVGHLDRVARIEKALASHAGLVAAGAAYRGIGIADCIRQGQEAAARVVASLRTT
jgi:oxygen-dependent protoporphyrinogen oxidase